MNGDGRGDVAVGDPDASNNGRPSSGSAWVVFGQASTTAWTWVRSERGDSGSTEPAEATPAPR